MKILKKFNISSCGDDQFFNCKIDSNIYFTNNSGNTTGYEEVPSKTLTRFDISKNKFTNINLTQDCPQQVLHYQNKLLISHYNPAKMEGKDITIYDLATGNQKRVTMRNTLCQISIKGDKLYSIDEDSAYIYQIKDDYSFDLIQKKKIKTNRTDNYYYLGGFFFSS